MKNMEEAMMVVDYSQGDEKMKLSDKNNSRIDSPKLGMGESKMEPNEECKQGLLEENVEKNAGKGLSLQYMCLILIFDRNSTGYCIQILKSFRRCS